MQGHLVLLHALFACCLQQGGGAGAYGAERTFRQCVYGHFPHPETFDREGGHQQAACRAGEARFVYATGARCVPVCFYACGMPFVDVAFLKKSQIKGGILVYHRRKTDQVVQIKLEPCMQEIINRYRSDGSDYVFPFLTSQDEDTAYREYKRKFSYYNKTLKTLGKLAGVDKPLSSYVARHTWATLAFMSSVDMSVIAQALGHTDVKTTRIYVEDIGNGKQNSANKKLLDEVLRKRSSVQEVTSVQE